MSRISSRVIVLGLLVWNAGITAQPAHFDAKGKPPSPATQALQEALRQGAPDIPAARGTSPDLARAMTTTQWWDAIATRVDSGRADGLQFVINFSTPDTGQVFVVELSGGTLTNIEGFQSDRADATIVMNRSDLDTVIMGQATLAEQLQAGVGSVSGDQSVLLQLASLLVEFDPGFEVMPGTR